MIPFRFVFSYRKSHLTLLMAVLLLFGAISSPLVLATDKKKSVLILHSYHKGLSWTDSITRGIEKRFTESGMAVEFSYEYMDTKRFFSRQHYANLERLYRTKYGENDFDVIIASDDNAYRFLLHEGRDIFGRTPVVFCGVNNYKPEDLRGIEHITGVEEDFDFQATIEAALQLQKNVAKVVVIVDRTTTGYANREKLMAVMPHFSDGVSFEFLDNYPMEAVLKHVSQLENAIVFWLHFTADGNGRFFSFEDSSELISEASSVPLYSSWDFHMGHGIVGGMITSGEQQGYAGAGLALRILQGEAPTAIPVVHESPNTYMFDYNQLKRFGIDRDRLPEDSSVINVPDDALSRYKNVILAILSGFIALLCIIFLLFANNIKRQRAENAATAAMEKYLGIYNETSIALLVMDFSVFAPAMKRIDEISKGTIGEYLHDNEDETVRLGNMISVRDANPAALHLYGAGSHEISGKILGRVKLIEKSVDLIRIFTALLNAQDDLVFETDIRTLDGQSRNVIVRMKLPAYELEHDAVLVSIVDITERKKTEEALAVSESRFRTAFNSAASGMAIMSPDGTILQVNKVLCSTLGYDEHELLGMNWRDITHPDDIEISQQSVDRLMAGDTGEPFEKRYISKNGETIWVLFSGALIDGGKDRDVALISQFQDITKRKRAEQKLVEQKEQYRKYFEDDLAGVFVATSQGTLQVCNQPFCAIFGLDGPEQARGYNFFRFFLQETDAQRFHGSLEMQRKLEQQELKLKKVDGTSLNVVVNAIGRFNRSGKLREIQGYVLDVTTQKVLEAQLLQSQKLESIGTMAGGVAHDFNNLLMGVLGNTSLLLIGKDANHPDYTKLKNIEEYVTSGSSLTKQLLGFAKGGKYEVTTVDINEVIRGNATLFGQTRKELEVHLDLLCGDSLVDVDKSQIDQVMYNLYVNAWQAMPEGGTGTIEIRTANVHLAEGLAELHGVAPGQYVKIEVEDSGAGMDADTLRRIFDPFFTTKEISRGIGLGLASSYGIIRNHGGMIEASSEPGVGSCFTILLPVSAAVSSPEEKHRAEEGDVVSGRETVLLVDDEEMIVEVGSQMLEALGYTVYTSTGGTEAIELYRQHRNEIDLVILDMIMPGMGGSETYDSLKTIDPNVCVILSSGYSLDEKAGAIIDRGCRGFLQKPFDLQALSEKTRLVLDSEATTEYSTPPARN